jgi:spermidine synthase
MHTDHPYALALGYTRTMMGFLLFNPSSRRIAMIGLGGGSLAKFCLQHLATTHFTAVEINPAVLKFRDEFRIPADSSRFQVLCADGADYVRDDSDPVDVLLVDGFDAYSPPPDLCSANFYDNCHNKLTDGGVMVANLWGGDGEHELFLARIRDSFDRQAVMIKAESDSNRIVFAVKGGVFPPEDSILLSRAVEPDHRHPIKLAATAQKILGKLRPGRAIKRQASSSR